MNPFEYFQQMKPQIERDDIIMRNLRSYAFHHGLSLSKLGEGSANRHFRIGKLRDLWLSTREHYISRPFPEVQRQFCETYIDTLVLAHESGKRVPKIIGGVKANSTKSGKENYFLLLEDLTAGEHGNFIPADIGSASGTIDGVEIFYDFQDILTDLFRYMVGGNMIDLLE